MGRDTNLPAKIWLVTGWKMFMYFDPHKLKMLMSQEFSRRYRYINQETSFVKLILITLFLWKGSAYLRQEFLPSNFFFPP